MADFIPTVGIETHVQLKTVTKLFSGVSNDASQAEPNSLISHIDAGLPGSLPVLNEKAIELAVRAAFALNTKPQKFSKFDRKHYFYPDLPKGYQITQYDQPIILGGFVKTPSGVKVGITRIHLEEDAGKNIHPAGADYSLVDLNRAGTPLLEIVSEPEIHSAADAKAYARELYLLMKYADVSDCDLYLGHMRFDINVSLSSKPGKLGTRAEIKNLNSFRSVENAVAYEIKRQTELLKKGQEVIQETRGWDETKQKTTSQRGKEEAHDYRYMPEPDIPPVELTDEFIEEVKANTPESPAELRSDLKHSGLNEEQIESVLDNYDIATAFRSAIKQSDNPAALRLWSQSVVNNVKLRENLARIENKTIKNSLLAATAASTGKLNSNQFTHSLNEIILHGKDFSSLNLMQVSDEGQIEKLVTDIIKANSRVVADIKAGNEKAISFLVGQIMAKSKGQVNPQMVQKIIKKQIGV